MSLAILDHNPPIYSFWCRWDDINLLKKSLRPSTSGWHLSIILATWETKIRRITVQSQPRQIVCKTLYQKTLHKNKADGLGGVAQGEDPKFKPQYHQKQQKKSLTTVLSSLASKCDPSNLHWDYRREPPHPGPVDLSKFLY
jgi:hypothetical protein